MALQTFTAGQVLTATQMTNLQANAYNQTVSTKTASYTLVAADVGTRIVMNSASATTITVNTGLFAAGDSLWIHNIGAGTCTITAGTATVSTSSNLVLQQWDAGWLYFTSTGVAIFFPQAGSNTGLQHINTTSFTTSSATSLAANTFTSSYTNYYLMFNFTAFSATNASVLIRLRASGTDATGTDYNFERQRNENGSLSATRFAGVTYFQIGAFNTSGASRNFKEVHIYAPQETVNTSFWTISNYVDNAGSLKTEMAGGYHGLSTSYDSLTIYPDSGTMSGTVSVYGLRKS